MARIAVLERQVEISRAAQRPVQVQALEAEIETLWSEVLRFKQAA